MRLEARWQGGSTIKARTATASTCPLVQQVGGKEEDKEWGSQMIQDYGFRIYNPTIGKFLSVDPLTKEYPELTTYQFASNTPIQAIDLDGLEAFFIHGTMSSSTKRWFNQYENDEGKLQLRQHDVTKTLFLLTDNITLNAEFNWGSKFLNWGNGATNNQIDRNRAAKKLTKHVMNNYNKEEGVITLVGHSHGGNVAIQAAKMIRQRLDEEGNASIEIHIITIATPASNGGLYDLENPENSKDAINSHIHIYNTIDKVQTKMANAFSGQEFTRTYDNDFTINYELKGVTTIYGEGLSTDAHSVDYYHPELVEAQVEDITKLKYQAEDEKSKKKTKQND